MAEMCGPSNGLSNFQKHTTVDRTLQQDRLIARQSPSQGFRSNTPNARNLDPEFAAFQSGNVFHPQELQQSNFLPPQAQAGPTNWASDFQRMNISNAQQPMQNAVDGQAQQMNMNGAVDWNKEFSRQQNVGPSSFQAQQQQPANWGNTWDIPNYAMAHATPYSIAGPAQMPLAMEAQQPMEEYDEAAFERAFQDAEKFPIEEQAQIYENIAEQVTQYHTTTIPLETLSQPIENLPLNQPLLGADTIHDPTKPLEETQKEDPDALAKTAQQLIHNLSGDTRSKMQGSEFMKLMRGFASGTQVVRGDDVVLTDEGEERERLRRGMGDLKPEKPIERTTEEMTAYHNLLHICQILRTLLLSPPRPFIRTPTTVHTLLLTLLHIPSLVFRLKHRQGFLSGLKSVVEKVICSEHLNGIPSVRILAIAVLAEIKVTMGLSSSGIGNKSPIINTLLTANTTISLLPSPTPNTLKTIALSNTNSELENQLKRYKKAIGTVHYYMMLDRGCEEKPAFKRVLERILGYEILGMGDGAWRVHLQRVCDIFGPEGMEEARRPGGDEGPWGW